MEQYKQLLISIIEQFINLNMGESKLPSLQEYHKVLVDLKEKYGYKMKNYKKLTLNDVLEDIDSFPEKVGKEQISIIETIEEIKKLNEVLKSEKDLGSSYELTLEDDEKEIFKEAYHDLYVEIVHNLENNEEQIKSEEDTISKLTILNKPLENIITSLRNNRVLSVKDNDYISNVLNSEELNISDNDRYCIDLFLMYYYSLEPEKEITNINMDNIAIEEEEENVINKNKIPLSDTQLINLFKEFGYKYSKVESTQQDNLKNYGVLDNIRAIFTILKENNIVISENNLKTNLATMLIYSKPDIVSDFIKSLKRHEDKHLNDVFNYFLSSPAFFIKGFNRKQDQKNGDKYERNGEIYGYYNNYVHNLKFLEEKGAPIERLNRECISVFATTYYTLQDTYAKLSSYGIDKETIFNSASCLKIDDVYEKLDWLIELGLNDYYKKYPASADNSFDYYKIVEIKIAKDVLDNNVRALVNFNGTIKQKYINMILEKLRDKGELSRSSDETQRNFSLKNRADICYLFDSKDEQDRIEKYNEDAKKAVYISGYNYLNNKYINYLENNFRAKDNNDDYYDIDGVLISRRKVHRVLNSLRYRFTNKMSEELEEELLLYAITYKSILNNEEVEKIKAALGTMLKEVRGNGLN